MVSWAGWTTTVCTDQATLHIVIDNPVITVESHLDQCDAQSYINKNMYYIRTWH